MIREIFDESLDSRGLLRRFGGGVSLGFASAGATRASGRNGRIHRGSCDCRRRTMFCMTTFAARSMSTSEDAIWDGCVELRADRGEGEGRKVIEKTSVEEPPNKDEVEGDRRHEVDGMHKFQ